MEVNKKTKLKKEKTNIQESFILNNKKMEYMIVII